MGKLRDLTGQIFGRLIVVKRAGSNKNNKAIWHCKCQCGKEVDVLSERLCLSENTRSCGCLKHESILSKLPVLHANNVKPEAAFNTARGNYICSAKKRNLKFSLSDEELKALFSSSCYYCGSSPNNKSVADSGDVYLYNGVDRLDSTAGYVFSNCVACCITCNWMKKNMPVQTFINHVHQISNYTKEKSASI